VYQQHLLPKNPHFTAIQPDLLHDDAGFCKFKPAAGPTPKVTPEAQFLSKILACKLQIATMGGLRSRPAAME
jgi:hypothetical protein